MLAELGVASNTKEKSLFWGLIGLFCHEGVRGRRHHHHQDVNTLQCLGDIGGHHRQFCPATGQLFVTLSDDVDASTLLDGLQSVGAAVVEMNAETLQGKVSRHRYAAVASTKYTEGGAIICCLLGHLLSISLLDREPRIVRSIFSSSDQR